MFCANISERLVSTTHDISCFSKKHFLLGAGEEGISGAEKNVISQVRDRLGSLKCDNVAATIATHEDQTIVGIHLLMEVSGSHPDILEPPKERRRVPKPPKRVSVKGRPFCVVDSLTNPSGKFSHVFALTSEKKSTSPVEYVLKQYRPEFKARFELEKLNYGRLQGLRTVLGRHVPDFICANDRRLYIIMSYAGQTVNTITSQQFELADMLRLSTAEDIAKFRLSLTMQATWISYVFASNGVIQPDGHGNNVMLLPATPGSTWSIAYGTPGHRYIETTCPVLMVIVDYNLASTFPTSSTKSESCSTPLFVDIASSQVFTRKLFSMCSKVFNCSSTNKVWKKSAHGWIMKFEKEWSKRVGSEDDLERFYDAFSPHVPPSCFKSDNVLAFHKPVALRSVKRKRST